MLCLIGLVAGIHCGMVRRDLGKKASNSYSVPPASGYGVAPPAPIYGAAPASSYIAPSNYGPPIYYEDDDKVCAIHFFI